MIYTTMESSVGKLLLVQDRDGMSAIHFDSREWTIDPAWHHDSDAFDAVMAQLQEYFEGSRQAFDVPLAMAGTPFQQKVWAALIDIPYGETISYGDLARRIGQPDAVRAVGAANGRNPVPIIVPCHRVIGSSGKLIGYGGGLAIKAALLEHERRYKGGGQLQLL